MSTTQRRLMSLPLDPMTALSGARAEKARRRLGAFVRYAWPIVEPGVPLVDNWHIDAVADHLEAVARGQITRLVIAIPPGCMKSTIASVMFPAWLWVNMPVVRVLYSSHNEDLAIRDSLKTRSIVESQWYVQHFSGPAGWRLADDQNAKKKFQNTRMGFRQVIAVGSGTGDRGDGMVADDVLSVDDALSKPAREAVVFWWDQTMSTRLNDMTVGWRVLVGQRLHQADVSGHAIAQGYTLLALPHEYRAARRMVTRVGDRVLFEDPRKAEGELLFPAKFPAPVIEALKKSLTSQASGQLQQDPVADGGNMFKRGWWRWWRSASTSPEVVRPPETSPAPSVILPARFDEIIMSLDANFKKTVDGSRVCLQVWGCLGIDRYLLDQPVCASIGFDDTLKAIRATRARWPKVRRIFIEDKANGPAVIDVLSREMTGIIAVEPEGGKEARAHAIEPDVESGHVFLPEDAPWVAGYVDEFAAFPRGEHDDQVDTTTQAITATREASDVARLRMLTTL